MIGFVDFWEILWWWVLDCVFVFFLDIMGEGIWFGKVML